MKDSALCQELEAKVRKPSALPLDEYEVVLNAYSANFCHRNASAGWVHDKFLRLSGPRVATLRDGAWTSKNFGTHAPVMVWYSPEMVEWLRTWRPEEGVQLEGAPPPPMARSSSRRCSRVRPVAVATCPPSICFRASGSDNGAGFGRLA